MLRNIGPAVDKHAARPTTIRSDPIRAQRPRPDNNFTVKDRIRWYQPKYSFLKRFLNVPCGLQLMFFLKPTRVTRASEGLWMTSLTRTRTHTHGERL